MWKSRANTPAVETVRERGRPRKEEEAAAAAAALRARPTVSTLFSLSSLQCSVQSVSSVVSDIARGDLILSSGILP